MQQPCAPRNSLASARSSSPAPRSRACRSTLRSRRERTDAQREFIDAVRAADGLLLATPAYHAGMSGLVKNAIDLLEDLRDDARPYLHDRAVGCIVTAHGWQGAGTTLTSVRTIVHALRGWPTPLAVTMNTAERLFNEQGECIDEKVRTQLAMLAAQVVQFAQRVALAAPSGWRLQPQLARCIAARNWPLRTEGLQNGELTDHPARSTRIRV